MPPIRVLLVDDEADFREPVVRLLQLSGMEVVGAESAEEMDKRLAGFTPEVIIMDAILPGEDGFAAVERLRRVNGAGLVMLTARDRKEDRLRGLNHGADHYLTKPVEVAELEIVIRNLAGRLRPSAPSSGGAWELDAARWTLTPPGGPATGLTVAEARVLSLLFAARGEAVQRSELLSAIGRNGAMPEDRAIDVLLSRLRQKLRDAGLPFPLKAVRHVGYLFPSPARIRE